MDRWFSENLLFNGKYFSPASATSRLSCAPSVWTLPPAAWPDSPVCRLSIPLHCGYKDSASIPLHFEVVKSDETG